MAINLNTDFNLPRDAYATFDALTIKSLIKDRLKDGGNFTDQDFEGSNISSIIDIIAFSYHLSLFYLNQTSSEALFDESTVYENLNRITKLINYKPTGYKTSVLSFNAVASDFLPQNIYTIKRYSYFTVNGITYSFIKDAVFSKTIPSVETLETLSRDTLLYQGKYVEHPVQTAIGEEFETVMVAVKDTINNTPINIEHDSINVYVKPFGSTQFTEYSEVDSLFEEDPTAYAFEKRINESGFYELKFGNNINGVGLNAGDQVYVYYLQSDGVRGQVSPNNLNNNNINIFTTSQFEAISEFIYDADTLFLTQNDASLITFTNDNSSTLPSDIETVDQIRENAPKIFYSQSRIVTNDDFISYINKSYGNIVSSSQLVNNDSYINNVIKYYYDLGLDAPNKDSRFLFNQVKFPTTAQLNNMHAYLVPKIKTVDENNTLFFLTESQKAEIIDGLSERKLINADIIPQDPVYMAFSVGLPEIGKTPVKDDLENTFLVIERLLTNRISTTKIRELVNNVFIDAFKAENVSLGSVIDISGITSKILAIEGVKRIKTRKIDSEGNLEYEIPFLNMYSFNSAYADIDISSTSSNISLPFFKFPYL